MVRIATMFAFAMIAFVLLVGPLPAAEKGEKEASAHYRYDYWEDPYECAGCHRERFLDWQTSQMSRSYTGDFFQAQYFKVALKDADRDEGVAAVRHECIGCHSPSAFLSGDIPPKSSATMDTQWKQASGVKHRADRGVFCDFCHTVKAHKDLEPFNFNYVSEATAGIDRKRADLQFPWSPHHETVVSELHETAEFCGICHNEKNGNGVWVKATHREWAESEYAVKGITCQACHMPPRAGKPARMGGERPWNHEHNFGGGFASFVEGAARVSLEMEKVGVRPGAAVTVTVTVGDLSVGHKFPSGASEERDLWLRLGVYDDEGNELQHIRIPENPSDPNDVYFITSSVATAYPTNSDAADPIERDSLPSGDRLYHSAFLDDQGKVTFGQWYAVKDVENRLVPGETRTEKYGWKVPADLGGRKVTLKAQLWFRRMADSHADYLGIARRPHILVSEDVKPVTIGVAYAK